MWRQLFFPLTCHHRKRPCVLFLFRHKLKECVDRHNLIACGFIQIVRGYFFKQLIRHTVCSCITIVHRQSNQFILIIQESVVNTPGIKSKGIRITANIYSLFHLS